LARIPVIKAVNLKKEFKLGAIDVTALESVNLEIYSGEFIIFFGPSGCGKSTLMSMVAGLQPPSSGQVLIRGDDLTGLDDDQLADHRRSKIGMVFQAFNLISTMNVVENIALPLAFARIPRSRRMARAENLLEVVGMGEYKDHTPSELSGGQQQRIAIARSLVANPWIILADEPTGNLDSKAANEVMRLLISLNRKSKRTVVLITHNPEYVDYADRIFYMKDGKVTDVKVNSKVRKIEEVETVGKLRDDLVPEGKEEKPKAGEDVSPKADEGTEPSEKPASNEAEKPATDEPEKPTSDKAEKTEKPEETTAEETPAEENAEAPNEKTKKPKMKPIKLGK
jgi:putative ABC transport system ATP-binding protein